MDFCDCGGMLVPSGSGSVCRKCGRRFSSKVRIRVTTKAPKEDMAVIEDNKPDLPKTPKECKKCGCNEAYYWLIQTRSADEPPTQFFRCVRCRHTWREYK